MAQNLFPHNPGFSKIMEKHLNTPLRASEAYEISVNKIQRDLSNIWNLIRESADRGNTLVVLHFYTSILDQETRDFMEKTKLDLEDLGYTVSYEYQYFVVRWGVLPPP